MLRNCMRGSQSLWVRDRFLISKEGITHNLNWSQSLWVRDRFLIAHLKRKGEATSRNPFGSGTGF